MTTWRLLEDDGVEAAWGLAVDEALMARYARDAAPEVPTLRLYGYRDHCALIGRYQNLEAEVDLDACRATGVEVSRRLTGGGAIIMGAGQLGVAYVDRAPASRRPREIIQQFAGALIGAFASWGIEAAFRGKNDLEVEGRKIAGLGVYVDPQGALLFHASLLADLDVALMLQLLRIPAAKLAGRGISQVDERVTTVSRLVGHPVAGADLRRAVADSFAATFGVEWRSIALDGVDAGRAAQLAERYRSREWLDERSVAADASGSSLLRCPEGLVRFYLTTHGDLVTSAMVVGDFNELPREVIELESGLRWNRLDRTAVGGVVARSAASRALGVDASAITAAVLEAGRQAIARASAAPLRSVGSCYFPESSGGSRDLVSEEAS